MCVLAYPYAIDFLGYIQITLHFLEAYWTTSLEMT